MTLVVNSEELSLSVCTFIDVLAALKPELYKSELALILPSKISIYMAVAVQGTLMLNGLNLIHHHPETSLDVFIPLNKVICFIVLSHSNSSHYRWNVNVFLCQTNTWVIDTSEYL